VKKPQEILDEFETKLETITDTRLKVREIINFVIVYGDSYGVKMEPLIGRGINLSREVGFEAGEVICYFNLAFFSNATGAGALAKYDRTFPEIVEMISKLKGDTEWYPFALSLYAYFHWFKGEYEKAFNIIFECLKILEGEKSQARAWNYFALGVFYFDTKDFENSKINYQKAHDTFKTLDIEYGMARAANGMGTIAILQNKPQEALPYLEFAAGIYRKVGHYAGLSRAKNDMGMFEMANKDYKKAIEHLTESIELRKEIGHIQGLITSYTELGETYLRMKDHQKALEQLDLGMKLTIEADSKQKRMRLHKLFYETYKELGNTGLALSNFELFYELKTQLMSDEAAHNIKRIQTQYAKEKSEKEAEIERLKHIELKKAHDEIEQKQKEILDSIRYAKRIQSALMSSERYIEKSLNRLQNRASSS
jgi:tetratricopeptide (TPR) repeat protein